MLWSIAWESLAYGHLEDDDEVDGDDIFDTIGSSGTSCLLEKYSENVQTTNVQREIESECDLSSGFHLPNNFSKKCTKNGGLQYKT